MKLSIFGRHPVPQGGFNGVMSLFEAIEFSRLGYETTLLIPFKDHAEHTEFLRKNKIGELDDLERFGGNFAIQPVFPDGENFEQCDVLVYQSYFPQDWENYSDICRRQSRILTKNFPKFVPSPGSIVEDHVAGQFQQFDLVACALNEDFQFLTSHPQFVREHPDAFVFAPRGASPTLLHPGYKAGLPPTIGLDVPVTPGIEAIQHYFEPIQRLKKEIKDLRVVSVGRDIPELGAKCIPFGRFDRIYENFFNRIHVYCTINYEFSQPHLQARVQKEARAWRRKAIYEVQNVEAQMSGAVLYGHRENIIDELYVPGSTGLNFSDFSDPEEIYRSLKYAVECRAELGRNARRFAEANFAWQHCIKLWSDGIVRLDARGKNTPRHHLPLPARAAQKPANSPAPQKATAAAVARPPETATTFAKTIRQYFQPLAPHTAKAAPIGAAAAGSEAVKSEAEIATLVRLALKYKWATGADRNRLEKAGVNIVRSDMYSESPTLEDIEASFEYAGATGPTDSAPVFDDFAIFDFEKICEYARRLIPFAAAFDAPESETEKSFFWKNTQFSGTDALALYAMIRRNKPKTIIEIGSGYSTYISRQALRDNGGGRLICVDPEPRANISSLDGVEFIDQPIQSVDISLFQTVLEPGDIVFYDGSHTLKTGSDTVYFYLKILPYLRDGVLVHVHDVRLPYPRNKKALTEAKLYWGEPYLLMAHLHNTLRYEVLFASDLLERRAPQLSKELMQGKFGSGGVSLWMGIRNNSAAVASR